MAVPLQLRLEVYDWQPELSADDWWLSLFEGWKGWRDPVVFSTKPEQWSRAPAPENGSNAGELYDYVTIRKSLPMAEGHCTGWIKLTRGPEELQEPFLVSWSPPHVLRAIPILEFERFLGEVMEQPRMANIPYHERNMYDANCHLIRTEVTCLDASYAELRTHFGRANLFISHAWKETAYNTLKCIQNIKHMLERRRREATTARCSQSGLLQDFRVWFCIVANNQSRITEELGESVHQSPFAQVLHSPSCAKVALISPFLALERKWCNFEFCMAVEDDKPVLLVTTEGIVQEGEVAPRTLCDLSARVCQFRCREATCSSAVDEALIDEEVRSKLGNYGRLDAMLKEIIHDAIVEANRWSNRALARLPRGASTTTLVEGRILDSL